MSMVANTFDNQGRFWTRCQVCGDSQKRHWVGHRCNFPDGGYHCYKCGDNGQLGMQALLALALGDISIEEAEEWEPDARYGTVSQRHTLLTTLEHPYDPNYVTFEMCNCNGLIVGYHNRHRSKKTFNNEGAKGVGYVPDKLVSSPSEPIVVVEGPYDVVKPNYVSVFGTINQGSLKHLRYQHCWLFPDPDILDTIAKRVRFWQRVILPASQYVFIEGIILGNDDPDEATVLEHIKLKDWEWTV